MSINIVAIQMAMLIPKLKLDIQVLKHDNRHIEFLKNSVKVMVVFSNHNIHIFSLIGFKEDLSLKNIQMINTASGFFLNWDYDKVKKMIKDTDYYLDEKKIKIGMFAALCKNLTRNTDIVTIIEEVNSLATTWIELRKSCCQHFTSKLKIPAKA